MSKHIVIAAGGTGGHLFPAQALADAVSQKLPDYAISFMAKGITTNPRYKSSYPAFDITASGLGLRALVTIPRGTFESMCHFRKNRPELVIGFGSFHTFPILLAALFMRIPIILHEANRHPGKVNRLLSRFAVFTGVFFPDTKVKGSIVRTDIPARTKNEKQVGKEASALRYGLQSNVKTILVFGGSLGAKNLNLLAAKGIVESKENVQVVHFTGNKEQLDELRTIYKEAQFAAFVSEFEHEMKYAWSLADIVISRSGASTVNEQIIYATPAIFVPYPFAADNHQDANAEYVVTNIKGAAKHSEKGLTSAILAEEIKNILQPDTYEKMRNNLLLGQKEIEADSFSSLITNYILRDK